MPATTRKLCDRGIEWMGIRLAVPRDWDMARHSIQMRKGGLSFVDRHAQRLQVNWTQCRSEPLIDRMFDDHRDRQLEEDSQAHFERFKHGSGFDVLQRHFDHGQVVNRAARYDKKTKRLIEAVVLSNHNGADERALRDEVLKSIKVRAPADEARHFRAFGLDITVPENYRPVQAEILAADAALSFRRHEPNAGPDPGDAKPRREKARLRKIGMAASWDYHNLQKIPMAENEKVNFHFDRTVLHDDQTGEGRVEAVTGISLEHGPRLKRYTGFLRTRRDLLWHSPKANAVFHIYTLSFDKAPLDPRDFKLQPAMDGVMLPEE